MARAFNRLLANLGDENPLDHGGFFVYQTERDGSRPQAEILEVEGEDTAEKWTVYRFDLDEHTYVNGILSDNPYHPDYATWYADDLPALASALDITTEELASWFCSPDPIQRALAYREVCGSNDLLNFDEYPLMFRKRSEVHRRYIPALRRLKRRQRTKGLAT